MPFLRQNTCTVKILAVSDEVVERLYSLCNNGHFNDVELIIGCGDLPYPYLENIVTFLNVPLLYVPGNHDPAYSPGDIKSYVEGGSNLDLKLVRLKTFLIGGGPRCQLVAKDCEPLLEPAAAGETTVTATS